MYADVVTRSMRRAIDETYRRRSLQVVYNEQHGITPVSIVKSLRDLTERVTQESGQDGWPAPPRKTGLRARLPPHQRTLPSRTRPVHQGP